MRPTATRRALGIALLVPLLTFLTPAPVVLPTLAGADAPAATDPRALGDTPALPSEIPPLNGDIYAADPAYDDGLTDEALYEDAFGDVDAVYDEALYSEGYDTGFDTGYVDGTPSTVDPVTVPPDTDVDAGTPADYQAGYDRGYEEGLEAARNGGSVTPSRTTPPGSTPPPSRQPSTPPGTQSPTPPPSRPGPPPSTQQPSTPLRPPGEQPNTPLPGAPGCTPAAADRTGTPTGDGTTRTGMPAITVSGDCILRGGEPWWFTGYNSFVWSGDCGDPEERMTAADVERWFASMRHDGHGAVRLFFFDGWDRDRLRQAVASAERHDVYLTITLDDAIGGCGETEKDAGWFGDAGERAVYRAHMESLLTEFRGETAIAWFEFFNEPDHEGGALRAFYDEMGRVADAIDPTRLFSSGTVAPYWVDGPANFLDIHRSPGVDLASLHEYDEDEVESNHGDDVRANSAGKPVIVGEFGIEAAPSGAGCVSYDERARRIAAKLGAYTGQGYAGAFGWAWQPGRSGCELGNLDDDQPSQRVFRDFAAAGSVALAALPTAGEDAAAPLSADPAPPAPGAAPAAPPSVVPPVTTPAPAPVAPAPAAPAPAPVTPTPTPIAPAPAAPAPVTTSPPPQPDPEPAPAPDPEPRPTTPAAAPTSAAAVPSTRPAAPPSAPPSATAPRPTASDAAPSSVPATTAPAPTAGGASSSSGTPDPAGTTPAP